MTGENRFFSKSIPQQIQINALELGRSTKFGNLACRARNELA